MSRTPEDLLALPIGGTAVAENLARAIASGAVRENADGTLELTGTKSKSSVWVDVGRGPKLGCEFLKHFVFRQVYAEAAVPHGCQACYKVKAVPRTLRELVAAWEIAKSIECRSKWGIDFYNRYSQSVYAGLFYVSGLDAARVLYKVAREAFDRDAKLGPDVPLTIKRGCSDYEAMLGPSDRYEFTPEMAELEAYLKSRFRGRKAAPHGHLVLAHWIDFAYRMGDDTYLDFTGGKPLHRKAVSYAPE